MVLEPSISFIPGAASLAGSRATLFTLAMVDPDAPVSVSSTYEPFGHFLVGNIQLPESLTSSDEASLWRRPFSARLVVTLTPSEAGEVIFAYRNPHPAEPRDHRYTLALFAQPSSEPITFDEDKVLDGSQDGRCFFNISAFALKYDLGAPIGIATALVRNITS